MRAIVNEGLFHQSVLYSGSKAAPASFRRPVVCWVAMTPSTRPDAAGSPTHTPTPARTIARSRGRRLLGSLTLVGLCAVVLYGAIAYLILPALWQRYETRHPALAKAPWITHTGSGVPGDPVDIGLVGVEIDLHRAMLAAGWSPADPITLRSSLRIAQDVVFRKAYVDAPVSNLYLYGRKEDFAFEQPVGDDPTRRHHVRFWRSDIPDAQGRPLWLGAATLDVSVGFSHDNGQITHHISPDVDAERELILADLKRAGRLASVYRMTDFHQARGGTNGEGDPWRSDGSLAVGVLAAGAGARTASTPAAP